MFISCFACKCLTLIILHKFMRISLCKFTEIFYTFYYYVKSDNKTFIFAKLT